MFDDLLEANRRMRVVRADADRQGIAGGGTAVVACMDSRIDPLGVLGLELGEAIVLRNAGARVTTDVLRSLVIATNLLGVTRVCIIQHTDCAMAAKSEDELRLLIGDLRGLDASDWTFLAMSDQMDSLRSDIGLVRSCPLMGPEVEVGGFQLDIRTGSLTQLPD